MKRTKTIILASLAVLLSPIAAQATLISGTGDTGSNATLAAGTLIDFEATAAGQYASITINGVTISVPGVDLLDIDGDFAGSFNTRGTQSLSNDFDGLPVQFRFDFVGLVNAFGFNWGASDVVWQMDVYGTGGLIESHDIGAVSNSNAGDYFGASAAGISYAILTSAAGSTDYVFIDDFRYVGAVSVPEPGTLALLGLGQG
jgi:hypothetical protein